MSTTPNTPANGGQILTDERIADLYRKAFNGMADRLRDAPQQVPPTVIAFGRAIEADLRAALAAPDMQPNVMLVKAARAAIEYDRAISSCANDQDLMSTYCTAQGESLDMLYANWISAAEEALLDIAAPAIPTVDRNSVLEGWKLVPIKPTLEMVHAMRYSTKSAPPFGVKRDPDKHELHHFGTGLAEAAYCRALAASPAVAQPAAQVAVSEDQRDAARWRAFVGSARIKPQGSAGLEAPRPNNYAYMGLEIWSVYDRDYPASMLESMDHDTALGAKWLTKYADIAIEEQRATPATVKTAEQSDTQQEKK